MHIHKVEIYNFRSHEETSVEFSKEINVLIGPNNTGKTSFLHALNLAIGWNRRTGPVEDDFFAIEKDFDPKKSDPIKIVLEFREIPEERFSENVISVFEHAIRFDRKISQNLNEPIRFFRICYECQFDKEKDKFVEDRYFVDEKNQRLRVKKPEVTKEHLSFIPFFYIPSLRDINREIKAKGSFWGRLKSAIDYSQKREEIEKLMKKIDEMLLSGDQTVEQLKSKLQELENSIRITSNAISLHAFTRRTWELLDDLNIYLKLPNVNLSLPISKHGAGTQNIIVLLIFSAYLDILLSKIVDNKEATPIIGLEEPEAHIHPHAQRALFHQIAKLKGQKIISTHSPYIVEQANIYDYVVFKLNGGVTKTSKIPRYKRNFVFTYGLPKQTYQSNKFLTQEEELKIKRYIQFKNQELFFASLFLLCEGDTEKIFLEQIIPYYLKKSPGQLGVSIIPCDGKAYSPFLKIAHKDAFDIKWILQSDGEDNTIDAIKNMLTNLGYDFEELKNRQVFFLPEGMDFERYIVDFYGADKIIEVIKSNDKLNRLFTTFKNQPINQDLDNEEIINKFLDVKDHKVFSADILAQYIIQNKLKLPEVIENLLNKIKIELENI
jgi:putative ATP-dependent endonuclease of OLD family